MTRYFFDSADGDSDIDHHGVELPSDDDAIREAVRYAGSLVSDQPELLEAKEHFVVTLRHEVDGPLAKVEVALKRL